MGHCYPGDWFRSAVVILDLVAGILRPLTANSEAFICTGSSLWPNNRGAGCLQIVGICVCNAPRTLGVCCLWKSISACEPVSASRYAQASDDSCGLRIHCCAVRTGSAFNRQRQNLLV